MNQEEAIHVLETIKDIYPTYAISKIKAKMLIPELLPMDYSLVMEKLAKHVKDHPYAPTISEIAAYPKQQNEQLDSLKKWREQAKKEIGRASCRERVEKAGRNVAVKKDKSIWR